jgi:hypothetical protein
VKACIDEAGALTAAVVMCWRPRSSTPDDSGRRILLVEYVAAPTVLGGGAGNAIGRKSRKRPSLFGHAPRSHSALVDRVDGRDRLYRTSPVSNRSEV